MLLGVTFLIFVERTVRRVREMAYQRRWFYSGRQQLYTLENSFTQLDMRRA